LIVIAVYIVAGVIIAVAGASVLTRRARDSRANDLSDVAGTTSWSPSAQRSDLESLSSGQAPTMLDLGSQ
jgi:hypothetical protein